jgi:hypothetical protein
VMSAIMEAARRNRGPRRARFWLGGVEIRRVQSQGRR